MVGKSESASGVEMDGIIRNAVIVAILVGFLVTLYFVFEGKEGFSALYIKPDSYSNYVVGDEVSFIYGVRCFEGRRTGYVSEIFLGDYSLRRDEFEMEPGERLWNVSFKVPEGLEFPVKVRVVLTKGGEEYDAHFWLKGRV